MRSDYSIVYGNKITDFATRDACIRAFANAVLMIDNQIHPDTEDLLIQAVEILGEVVIVYEHGTQFEVRMHGVTWQEWEEHGPPPNVTH